MCYNCLDKICTLFVGRFPKLCLDKNTKRDIGLLWICAYTECGRGHPEHEINLKNIIKEQCAQLCNKPVDINTDISDKTDSNKPATKVLEKRPAEKNNKIKPEKKSKINGKKDKATPGQKVKNSKQ